MARVTVQDVQSIYPTNADVLPFIFTASLLTDLYFGASGYSAEQLGLIEMYWAAHIATGGSAGVVETKLGDTSVRYSDRDVKAGLSSTRFGETVLLLDTDHILAAASAAEEVAVTLKPASFYID